MGETLTLVQPKLRINTPPEANFATLPKSQLPVLDDLAVNANNVNLWVFLDRPQHQLYVLLPANHQ